MMKKQTSWEVTVGNIGNVYSGNGTEARRVFAEYRAQSVANCGRASGEDVTLWKDGEPVQEFTGSLAQSAVL
jgi:hypothetical protein